MILDEKEINFFLAEDKNYINYENNGWIAQTCKICGCIIDIYYCAVHRINCHPIKIEIKNAEK